MDAEIVLMALLRLQLVLGAAILVVLLLRPLVLRWWGARLAYWLWLVVPIAAMAGSLPAREQVVVLQPAAEASSLRQPVESASFTVSTSEQVAAAPLVETVAANERSRSGWLLALWLAGAGALLIRSIVNTRRLASSSLIGPALIGVWRPRLVLPRDFDTRFDAEERALILAHEEMHRVSRHTVVNALVEVARCASWFNPLVHLAVVRFRADQELACDTAVIEAHPEARRTYAEALLKAQIAGIYLPMGCVWTSGTARRLGERIERLSEQLPDRRRRLLGAAAILCLGTAAGYAAWAQQPAQIITVQQPVPKSAVVPFDAPAAQTRDKEKVADSGAPAPALGPAVSKPVVTPVAARSPVVQTPPIAAPAIAEGERRTSVSSNGEMGGARTLTIIDGHPVVSGLNSHDQIDPNIIPSNLLRRMDVVTGGASATYGSGAMAGVVNLVLNNRLAGFQLDMDKGVTPASEGIPQFPRSPAAEFFAESVNEEWQSRTRNEIIESLALIEGIASTAQIDCRSSTCRVELKWPAPAGEESDEQRQLRNQRIAGWANEVVRRSGFVQSDTSQVANQPRSLSFFTMKPLSPPARKPVGLWATDQ